MPGINESIIMSRRYPKLPKKVLARDAKITKRIIHAWDQERNSKKVLEIFLKERHKLSHERYWELMRSVWIITGNVPLSPLFRDLMQSTRRSKHYFSTPEEAKQLRQLPDEITVYRATNDENDGGLSWTTSIEYAKEYQKAYNKKLLLTKTIDKKDIFAYIERNNEKEIILL